MADASQPQDLVSAATGDAYSPAEPDILAQLLTQPQPPTLVEIPRADRPRAQRIMLKCLSWFNSNLNAYRRHPGHAAETQVWKASAYLYLLPALLFRREIPSDAQPRPDDGHDEDALLSQPQPAAESAAAGSDRRSVARRLQLAEKDQWDTLLLELRADAKARQAMEYPTAPARRRSDDARHAAAVERVLRDDLRGALSLLRGQEMAPPTESTAREVERLMCMDVTPAERAATLAEASECRKQEPVIVATKDVKRRVRALQERRRAGPGPSGWRNSYICSLAAVQGGPQQLSMWTTAWACAQVPTSIAAMWTGQIAAPQDCGPRKDDPARRKLRPIALEECLVKFAESVACDKALSDVLKSLEPTQQGAGSPDGTVILVSLLRRWGERAKAQAPDTPVGDLQLLFSSDLANAYGQAFRSALLRGLRLKAPQLAAFLGTKWANGANTVWQRLRTPAGQMTWHASQAERGGGQGSRLMMTAFCCAVQVALEQADAAAAAAARACARATASSSTDAPLLVDPVRHAGYQDDQYFNGTVASFELYEDHLLHALARDGHALQSHKCSLWVPALDGIEDETQLDPRLQALFAKYPRAIHGITALGASSDGDCVTYLESSGHVGLAPVKERAAKCKDLVAEIREMVRGQVHPQTFWAAWTLLHTSCARAFDYDARLVAGERLAAIVKPAYDAITAVVGEIAGGMSARAQDRVCLSGPLGGCGLRKTALIPHAHAALWAAHAVNAPKLLEVHAALGGGGPTEPPPREQSQVILGSIQGLRAAGIVVTGDFPVLEPSARERFLSTPWHKDQPIDETLQPRKPRDGDSAARPKLAGALFAALDALQAANLWEAAPEVQKTIMLSSGGTGTGSMWSMRGVGERRALQNGHFREALRLRLGDAEAPADAVCQLRHKQHEDGHAPPCGQPLCEPSGECTHPLQCDAAAARLRPHRAVSTSFGRNLRAAGAEVDYERHVPHMYKWEPARNAYTEAILDVVGVWPGDSVMRCYDITIASPHAKRVNNPWRRPGAAARAGEYRKQTRYGDSVRPLSFEAYGRLGPRSLQCLDEAAREAALFGRADMPARQLKSRWRADMELALAYAQADAVLAARGALPHVAGPLYHPVGRMVRGNAAAGGERREALTV